MNIYEKIKSMSIMEMAEFLRSLHLSCEYSCEAQDAWCKKHWRPCCEHCTQAIAEWLESEVEE